MSACVSAVPALFLQVNILFAVYAGAALCTSCRLWWDPTLYAPLREVWREEYRVATLALPLLAAALLALPYLALRAVLAPPTPAPPAPPAGRTRCTLIAYIWVLVSLVAGSVVWCWWTARRLGAWLATEQAREIQKVVALSEHIQPLIDQLDKWMPLPDTIKSLIQEAKDDLPRNGYAACTALSLLVLSLLAAAVLALLLLRTCPNTQRRRMGSDFGSMEVRKPLKSLDKGRLVLT